MPSRAIAFMGLLAAAQLGVAGCGSSSNGSPNGGNTASDNGTPIHPFEPAITDATFSSDAGAEGNSGPTPAALFVGNAICHASAVTGCYPDTTVDACQLAPDAGESDAEGDAGAAYPNGCHVVTQGMEVTTTCLPSKLQGMYASTCTQSTDCAPGWECVSGGTCRHYCCGGNSACSNNQFCDVQPTAMDPATRVPVCVGEFPCTLLDSDSCPSGEQCSVVKEDGTTSCVALGPQGDGQSCELEHCLAGYVCLGTVGNRVCAPLCSTAATTNPCTNGRQCIGTLPLFKNALVGACQ